MDLPSGNHMLGNLRAQSLNGKLISKWRIWLVVFRHPSEKIYEFVNWDDRNPIFLGKCQIHGNQSPATREWSSIRCHRDHMRRWNSNWDEKTIRKLMAIFVGGSMMVQKNQGLRHGLRERKNTTVAAHQDESTDFTAKDSEVFQPSKIE